MRRMALKKAVAKFLAVALALGGVALRPAAVHAAHETSENRENHWETYDGKSFWYEDGVKQGTEADEKALVADGTVRGREICDPAILDEKGNGTWFWLDADPKYDGAKACNKEVWMPYIYQNEKNFDDEEIKRNAAESGDMAVQVEKAIKAAKDGVTDSAVIGKWVRYDADGKMVKGWYTVKGDDEKLYPTQAGNTYYYDFKTGLMAKGKVEIDGKSYRFDETTGALVEGKAPTDNADKGTGEGSGNGASGDAGEQTEGDVSEGTDAEKKTKMVRAKGIGYNADGSANFWYGYEYDDEGNLTKYTCYDYDADGSVLWWSGYEYDGAGNRTKEISYKADGCVDWEPSHTWEYDDAGNQTKEIWYNADGSVWYWYEWEYDSTGKQTKYILYNADGNIDNWYEYEYNGAGNQTKTTWYNADGSVRYWYEYEYDGAGNETKQILYHAVGFVGMWHEYEYDGAGNRTKATWYNADGSASHWYELEYDGAGNQTKQIYYKADGSVDWEFSCTWEYDGAGNQTKETWYNADGSVSVRIEYEYKTITLK